MTLRMSQDTGSENQEGEKCGNHVAVVCILTRVDANADADASSDLDSVLIPPGVIRSGCIGFNQ